MLLVLLKVTRSLENGMTEAGYEKPWTARLDSTVSEQIERIEVTLRNIRKTHIHQEKTKSVHIMTFQQKQLKVFK